MHVLEPLNFVLARRDVRRALHDSIREQQFTYIIDGREIDSILDGVALELSVVVQEDITVRVVERDGIAAFCLVIRYLGRMFQV